MLGPLTVISLSTPKKVALCPFHSKTVVLNLPNATFNTVPHVVVAPKHKILLLLHNCNLATVMNCNLNIGVFFNGLR